MYIGGRFRFDTDKIVDIENMWDVLRLTHQTSKSSQTTAAGGIETQYSFVRHILELGRSQITPQNFNLIRNWFEYVKDGTSFELWIDRALGFYISFDSYYFETNDKVALTLSRTGTAKYIDYLTGLLETAAENTPKIVSGKYGGALSIEDSGFNFLNKSNSFGTNPIATPPTTYSQQGWVQTNLTVTSNSIEDIEGNLEAERLYCTSVAGGNNYQRTVYSTITYQTVTFSVWVKSADGGTLFQLGIEDSGLGTLAYETFYATSEFTRYEVTHTIAGAGNYWGAKIFLDDIGDSIIVCKAQLEPTEHSSSYKPDAVTQNAETCQVDLPEKFNKNKWTLQFWMKPDWDENNTDYRTFFNFYSSASSKWIIRMNTSGSIQISMVDENGSTQSLSVSGTPYGFVQDDWNLVTILFDGSIADGAKFYLNGSYIGTFGNSIIIPADVDSVFIGSSGSSTNYAKCLFDEILLLNDYLMNDNEILNHYNQDVAVGIGRNYFDNMVLQTDLEEIFHSGSLNRQFKIKVIENL